MDPLAKSCMKTYAELTEEKKPGNVSRKFYEIFCKKFHEFFLIFSVLPTPVPSNMQEGEEGDEGNFFKFPAKKFEFLKFSRQN